MKKRIIIVILLTFALFITPAIACSPDPTPDFEIHGSNLDRCYFSSYGENLSLETDVVEFIKERDGSYNRCDNLTLNHDDQTIFRDIINKLNKENRIFTTIYIEKQTDDIYPAFLEVAKKINDNKCDCERIGSIERYGQWTVYMKSSDCGHDTSCTPIPPAGCPIETFKNVILPYLLILLFFGSPLIFIVLLIIFIILVIRTIKNKKTKGKIKLYKKWWFWLLLVLILLFLAIILFFYGGIFI